MAKPRTIKGKRQRSAMRQRMAERAKRMPKNKEQSRAHMELFKTRDDHE